MKKILLYSFLIGTILSGILYEIVSGAPEDYPEVERIAIAFGFICLVSIFGVFHSVVLMRAGKLKTKPSLKANFAISAFVAMVAVIFLSLIAMLILDREVFFRLVLENEYIGLAFLAGFISAYYSRTRLAVNSAVGADTCKEKSV